jgi:hypothetical protein
MESDPMISVLSVRPVSILVLLDHSRKDGKKGKIFVKSTSFNPGEYLDSVVD